MSLRRELLAWYDTARRDLPWRRTRDPYAIWVSEVMLQQTQVAAVLPYWERFLARFPTLAALAEAPEDDVLAAWSGLGYYRRARHLQAGARRVLACHEGTVPAEPGALRALPGVGPYIAGAIASIAFDLQEPLLDGNVRRVLARLTADPGDEGDGGFWALARELVAGPRPGDWNQALMELGATVCTPQAPRCAACPIAARCRGRASGAPQAFPRPRPSRPSHTVQVEVAVLERGDAVLLEAQGSGGPLRGKWDLPAAEGEPLGDALRRRHGIEVVAGTRLARVTHTILHRRLRLTALACAWPQAPSDPGPRLRWMEAAALDRTPVSGATRKVLRATSSAASRAL